jgi:hypothetical protein
VQVPNAHQEAAKGPLFESKGQGAANRQFFFGDPVVAGWVRGQKRTGVRFIFISPIFFVVFLNSSHRETPKHVMKENREKNGLLVLDFFSIFL